MIPKSLSASSILVSEACMERWKVENFWRTPQMSSDPANVGTSVHFALEMFVKMVYLEGKAQWSDVALLTDLYKMGYVETFNSSDYDTPEFADGAQLVAKWYDENRDGLPDKVISCEVKENFPIKTSAGEIPFNFIWDRADQIDDETYRVVDYKTLRKPVRPEDLKKKIQPRAYALAAQIKWPHAKRIWVTFDMLRYGPVGVVFTKEENATTYRYLQRAAERIIAQDEDTTAETLNEECKWCIKKSTCDTLLKANRGGSLMGLSVEQIAERKAQIGAQLEALKYVNDELDKQLCLEAEERDQFEFDAGSHRVVITSRPRRTINSNAVANLLDQKLVAKYGNFTVTSIDKLLKSGEISEDTAETLRGMIVTQWGEPSAKVVPIQDFEEKK